MKKGLSCSKNDLKSAQISTGGALLTVHADFRRKQPKRWIEAVTATGIWIAMYFPIGITIVLSLPKGKSKRLEETNVSDGGNRRRFLCERGSEEIVARLFSIAILATLLANFSRTLVTDELPHLRRQRTTESPKRNRTRLSDGSEAIFTAAATLIGVRKKAGRNGEPPHTGGVLYIFRFAVDARDLLGRTFGNDLCLASTRDAGRSITRDVGFSERSCIAHSGSAMVRLSKEKPWIAKNLPTDTIVISWFIASGSGPIKLFLVSSGLIHVVSERCVNSYAIDQLSHSTETGVLVILLTRLSLCCPPQVAAARSKPEFLSRGTQS
jgi:hypothetical protein